MKVLNIVAFSLVLIGGLNWGLIGLFDFNLVSALLGIDTILSNAVYTIVGASAVYCALMLKSFSNGIFATKPTV